jgi:hypothetical protein
MPVLGPEASRLARQQHAVLTTHDIRRLGLTDQRLRRAVDRGELERVHPHIYRVAAAPRTWEQRVLLAVLAAGPGALASHRTAAALWGLDGSTRGVPELVSPRHLRSRAGLGRVHESTDLHLAEPASRLSIPCTGLVRTLVDLGAVVPGERVQQAIDDAIRRRMCSWEDLLHALVLHSRRGRRGVGPLRAVLEECYGDTVPDSRFNRLVERLLLDSNLPAPVLEHPVSARDGRVIARVDLAYPDALVAIELDGRKYHLTAEAFEADRQRQNRLELLGWTVLRYTWRHYVRTPWVIVGDVLDALRRADDANLRQIGA